MTGNKGQQQDVDKRAAKAKGGDCSFEGRATPTHIFKKEFARLCRRADGHRATVSGTRCDSEGHPRRGIIRPSVRGDLSSFA